MGLLGALFGSGEKKTSSQQSISYDPRVRRIQGMGENLYGQIANNPYAQYDWRQRVQGADPALMQRLQGVYGGAANLGQQGYDLMSQAGGMDITNPSAFYNPFQSNVIDAANANYDESLNRGLNAINSRASAQGAFNNNRLGLAYGQAAADMGRARAQDISQLQYGGYMDAMNRMRQMQQDRFGMGQGMAGMGFQGAQGLMGVGDYQRQIGQAGKNAQYEEFMRRQQDPYMRLGAMGQALQGPWGTTQTGKTTTKDDGGGLLGKIGGIASTVGGLMTGGALPAIGGLASGLFGGGQPSAQMPSGFMSPGGQSFGMFTNNAQAPVAYVPNLMGY